MQKDSSSDSKKTKKFLTLGDLSGRFAVPKSAYVLLLLLYVISNVMLSGIARSQDSVMVLGMNARISTFSGVFSSLGNIIIILMVVLFGKLGFITSLILLGFQYPLIMYSVFCRNSIASIPGLFSNTFSIVAAVLIYIYNRRIRKYQ